MSIDVLSVLILRATWHPFYIYKKFVKYDFVTVKMSTDHIYIEVIPSETNHDL